jgi:hypothetical protein
MACAVDKGWLLPCKDGVGGISALYIIEYLTITPTYLLNVLTDIGTVTAYKFDIKSASNLIQTQTSSGDNGTTFVDQIITAILQRLNHVTDDQLKLMAYGRQHIVVEYKTGESVMVGVEFGASLETSIADGGTAMGDLHGYTLTINASERLAANYLEGSVVGDPFGGLSGAGVVTVVPGTELSPA